MALLNPESSQAIQDSKFLFAQPLVDDQVGKAIREALGFAKWLLRSIEREGMVSSTQSPALHLEATPRTIGPVPSIASDLED
jgi:hypothetical protein